MNIRSMTTMMRLKLVSQKNIPMDYTGLMGVPITFIYKLNPNQFELVDIMIGSKVPHLNGKNYMVD